MEDFTICRAVVDDAKEIIDYLNCVGGETGYLSFDKDSFFLSVEEEEELIVKASELGSPIILVARSKVTNEVVAVATANKGQRRKINNYYLGVSVKKKFWRRGIGEKMLTEVIAQVKSIPNAKKVVLEVVQENAKAVKLYQKLGFSTVGVLRDDVQVGDKFFDCLIMEKLLYE